MIVIGIDPGLGGGHAMVCAHLGSNLTVLDARVEYGLQRTEEQLDLLQNFVVKYRPNLVIIEVDAQQKGLGNDERLRAMSLRHGFKVRSHLTRGIKSKKSIDDVFAVAAMDQSFMKGEIRIPWGDQATIDAMTPLVNQLRAWRPSERGPSGKMKYTSAQLTQDLVMGLWFIHLYWMSIKTAHVATPAPASRPSWLWQDRPVAVV